MNAKRKDLHTTKMTLKSHNTKKHSVYYFEPFQLYSSDFDGPLEDQIVYFDLIMVKDDVCGKVMEIVAGSSQIELKPLIELEYSSLLQLKILDKLDRLVGKLSFGHCRVRPVLTFLDYKINLNINFVPIIAVDYSLSNKLFLKDKESMHGLGGGHHDNDYIAVINHIRHVYKDISQYCMGFGMGGKTCPKQVHASDIFSLSGNMFDPTISYNKVLEFYEDLTEKVELSLPISFYPILELVTRYAKHEFDFHKGRNYYCLFYITPGIIDDVSETVEALQEIYGLPLTVNIIKLFNPNYADTNDPQLLLDKFLELKKESKRQSLFVLDYQSFKTSKKLNDFEQQLIFNLPPHVGMSIISLLR